MMTAPNEDVAKKIASVLVEEKLAACCTIYGVGMRSVYRWEGAVHDDSEVSLHAKSTRSAFPSVVARVKQIHPYKVPEIIAIPIVLGSPEYTDWVSQSVPQKI